MYIFLKLFCEQIQKCLKFSHQLQATKSQQNVLYCPQQVTAALSKLHILSNHSKPWRSIQKVLQESFCLAGYTDQYQLWGRKLAEFALRTEKVHLIFHISLPLSLGFGGSKNFDLFSRNDVHCQTADFILLVNFEKGINKKQ